MTRRLKILSFFLLLSIVYAVYDYVERNKDNRPAYAKKKETKKRARTAGVSKQRAIDHQKKMEALAARAKPKEKIVTNDGFLPLSENIENLNGWSRNPFVKPKKKEPVATTNFLDQRKEKIQIEEKNLINTLDGLIIETAVRMGQRAFVTINGQTFTEGDLINDAVIEKIEREKITFKIGDTRIIKDVGT